MSQLTRCGSAHARFFLQKKIYILPRDLSSNFQIENDNPKNMLEMGRENPILRVELLKTNQVKSFKKSQLGD